MSAAYYFTLKPAFDYVMTRLRRLSRSGAISAAEHWEVSSKLQRAMGLAVASDDSAEEGVVVLRELGRVGALLDVYETNEQRSRWAQSNQEGSMSTETTPEAADQNHVQFYKDRRGQYRWRAVARNGRIVATSGGDGYHNFQDALDGAKAAAECLFMTFGSDPTGAPPTA